MLTPFVRALSNLALQMLIEVRKYSFTPLISQHLSPSLLLLSADKYTQGLDETAIFCEISLSSSAAYLPPPPPSSSPLWEAAAAARQAIYHSRLSGAVATCICPALPPLPLLRAPLGALTPLRIVGVTF